MIWVQKWLVEIDSRDYQQYFFLGFGNKWALFCNMFFLETKFTCIYLRYLSCVMKMKMEIEMSGNRKFLLLTFLYVIRLGSVLRISYLWTDSSAEIKTQNSLRWMSLFLSLSPTRSPFFFFFFCFYFLKEGWWLYSVFFSRQYLNDRKVLGYFRGS